ncbi:hypothetical protein G6F59_016152 [Rhizopus arrhizus]|nr:hypothetical protein G6F59_016152 [Rhizopus arrhizus]
MAEAPLPGRVHGGHAVLVPGQHRQGGGLPRRGAQPRPDRAAAEGEPVGLHVRSGDAGHHPVRPGRDQGRWPGCLRSRGRRAPEGRRGQGPARLLHARRLGQAQPAHAGSDDQLRRAGRARPQPRLADAAAAGGDQGHRPDGTRARVWPELAVRRPRPECNRDPAGLAPGRGMAVAATPERRARPAALLPQRPPV